MSKNEANKILFVNIGSKLVLIPQNTKIFQSYLNYFNFTMENSKLTLNELHEAIQVKALMKWRYFWGGGLN